VTDHHRFLLKQHHLGHIDFLVEEIKEFDEEIQRKQRTTDDARAEEMWIWHLKGRGVTAHSLLERGC